MDIVAISLITTSNLSLLQFFKSLRRNPRTADSNCKYIIISLYIILFYFSTLSSHRYFTVGCRKSKVNWKIIKCLWLDGFWSNFESAEILSEIFSSCFYLLSHWHVWFFFHPRGLRQSTINFSIALILA